MNNRISKKTAPNTAAIEDDMMYSILRVTRIVESHLKVAERLITVSDIPFVAQQYVCQPLPAFSAAVSRTREKNTAVWLPVPK